jgi:hypothetical protein
MLTCSRSLIRPLVGCLFGLSALTVRGSLPGSPRVRAPLPGPVEAHAPLLKKIVRN